MPDIRIVCEHCGSDRFIAAVNSPLAEVVHSIQCADCAHPVRVDEVVIFRDGTYISGTFDTSSGTQNRLNDFDI
ncbi:DNA-directed RNA polymerase subunit RPC12/RpoP [Rahnella sp. BIGb0603]|jgi:DNA-directed RNA polymerase subunit RPC12/RpoP|nr:DNA-directed RNA polymerase subunit RPC12/RpoP [Rahnella sp. BIGb0603]